MKKKISVVVLIYNNIEFLHENLMSIKNQNYENIEIIISDDCSSKISLEDIERQVYKTGIEERYEVIIQRLSKNRGIIKNFNTAIKRSSGQIIVPLSCDDLFYNDTVVSKIVDYFDTNNKYLFASGQLDMYTKNLDKYLLTLPEKSNFKYFNGYNPKKLLEKVISETITPGCSTVYTKEFFVQYGFFDETYHLVEDYTKTIYAVKKGAQIGLMPFKTIIYRSSGICSGEGLHPSVNKDVLKCITKEVIEDEKVWKMLSFSTKRDTLKKVELMTKYSTYKKYQKILFRFKYVDRTLINFLQRLKK